MFSKTLLSAAALSGLAMAAPAALEKRANIDVTILQFALTLEHLENAFYAGALQKFSKEDFAKAGYGSDYYNNLRYIAYDEAQHVTLLQGAIRSQNAQPVQPCTYSFPYDDVLSFITLSSVLEGVGTSAYLGAAPLVTNKQYLTVAGSILAVEALHTSMQRGAINEVPMANPLYTSLDGNSVYTLAAMFIKSCPSSNAKLPFTAFPSLQVNGPTATNEEPDSPSYYGGGHQYGGDDHHIEKRWGRHGGGWPKSWNPKSKDMAPPSAGDTVTFTAANNVPAGSYVTWISGLTVTSVPATVKGKTVTAKIPSGVMGQSYAFVTKSDVEGTFNDKQVRYGPAIVEVKPPAV